MKRFVFIRRDDLATAFPTFDEAWAFIRELQAQDDFVIWKTSSMGEVPPGFLASLNMVATGFDERQTLNYAQEREPEVTEGVIVGTSVETARWVHEYNKTSKLQWRFLLLKKLGTLKEPDRP